MNPHCDTTISGAERPVDPGMEASPCGPAWEAIYTSFVDFPDPVLVADRRETVVFLNRAAEKVTGHTIRQDSPLLCTEILKTGSGAQPSCVIEKCFEESHLDRVRVDLRNSEGRWVPFFLSAAVIKDKEGRPARCYAILRDIRADLIAQTEIHSQLNMLSSIIENYPTPFFTVDSNLVITYMNQPLERLTGYRREEAVNRLTCAEVLATTQCSTSGCLLRKAMEGRQPISGVRRTIVDREGRRIPVVANASILTDAQGRVTGGFEAIRDITPVVEAEEKIKLLTEMTQEGIMMVDENRRVVFANSKMGEILEKSGEELIGIDVSELFPLQHQQMIADLVRKVDKEQQQHLSFCTTLQPHKATRQDFRAFETCMAVSHIGKKVITCLYFRDLTKHIEIERQLRHANSFLSNIIRSSVDGIVVVDTEGKILIFNEGAESILGYSAEEAIGSSAVFRQFYDPGIAMENMRRMRSNEYGPPGKLNTTRMSFVRKNGEMVPVNFSAAIIKEGGREIGSVGIFSDRREHLRIRRELEEAKIQLLQSEKIASMGRLAAGVAHEINNPLAGILIYADLLMKEIGHNPQWSQDLEEIITQTLRCKQIVTRLLEFSRQPLGQRLFFNVNQIIDRCEDLLAHQSLFHNIRFIRSLQSDLPEVLGDPGQIQQVFTNLIINAANAMGEKGEIKISSRFAPDTQEVILKFADTGPGIPAEIMDKIFEPFFTTKRLGEGTGLGLSVAYGIVQQHGGTIAAENTPEGGAVFVVALPLESPEYQSEIIED